jgi:hypothetical protein
MLEYVNDWLAGWLADESLWWQQLRSALKVLPSIDHLSPLVLCCSWFVPALTINTFQAASFIIQRSIKSRF